MYLVVSIEVYVGSIDAFAYVFKHINMWTFGFPSKIHFRVFDNVCSTRWYSCETIWVDTIFMYKTCGTVVTDSEPLFDRSVWECICVSVFVCVCTQSLHIFELTCAMHEWESAIVDWIVCWVVNMYSFEIIEPFVESNYCVFSQKQICVDDTQTACDWSALASIRTGIVQLKMQSPLEMYQLNKSVFL